MKTSIFFLVTLLHILLNLNLTVNGTQAHEPNQLEEFERKAPMNKVALNDDSFEDNGEDEMSEDSIEYSQLGPPDINAYLYRRSLKKGFNAWAGKRELERQLANGRKYWNGKRLLPNKNFLKLRQRRRPWGGSA